MSDWKTVTVADIAAPTRYALATGPFGSAISSRYFRTSGVPVIRGGNLSLDVGVRLNENDLVFLDEAKASGFGRSIAVRGDLLFTCWGTVGQAGLIDSRSTYDRYVVSNKQMKLTPDNRIADSLFVYYALSSPAGVSQIQSTAIGSSVPGFNLSQLRSVSIRLPSLHEQQAISAVLGALDDEIAVDDRIVATSHELAQALTSRTTAEARRVSLSELATITMGSSPPGETYNETGVGLPFYQGTRDFGFRFPSRRVWCSGPVRTAEAGATLVSVRAPVGRLNVTTEKCCIGRGLAALVSEHETPSVLFHTLAATQDAWSPFESEGTVFGSISKQQLERLAVPVAEPAAARDLEDVLAPLDARVSTAFAESATLARLRDALLPGLMSGEIRVRDAERAVEEAT